MFFWKPGYETVDRMAAEVSLCVIGLGRTKRQTKRRQQMCVVEEERAREKAAGEWGDP